MQQEGSYREILYQRFDLAVARRGHHMAVCRGDPAQAGDCQFTTDDYDHHPGGPDRDAADGDFDDLDNTGAPEIRRHPLHGKVRRILESMDYPQDATGSPLASLWSAVATVSAKLAGALSSYERDGEPDAGFTIAQLKRCLVYIDEAVGEAKEASPPHVQPLLRMRQAVIDLQNELRGTL